MAELRKVPRTATLCVFAASVVLAVWRHRQQQKKGRRKQKRRGRERHRCRPISHANNRKKDSASKNGGYGSGTGAVGDFFVLCGVRYRRHSRPPELGHTLARASFPQAGAAGVLRLCGGFGNDNYDDAAVGGSCPADVFLAMERHRDNFLRGDHSALSPALLAAEKAVAARVVRCGERQQAQGAVVLMETTAVAATALSNWLVRDCLSTGLSFAVALQTACSTYSSSAAASSTISNSAIGVGGVRGSFGSALLDAKRRLALLGVTLHIATVELPFPAATSSSSSSEEVLTALDWTLTDLQQIIQRAAEEEFAENSVNAEEDGDEEDEDDDEDELSGGEEEEEEEEQQQQQEQAEEEVQQEE